MQQHNDLLAKLSLEKAEIALKSAELNLENNLLTEVQNRAYYSAFYIVLALAYLDGFSTGKHHKLMGWFNKKYIYQDKIFDKSLGKIYGRLLSNRVKFDYDVEKFPEKEKTIKDLEDAKFFVNEIKKYILSKIEID